MAFKIEDGVGRKGANSYVSVDFAREWSSDRGRSEFTGLTDDEMKVLLIRGTDYFEQRWSLYFGGERLRETQSLSWPRSLAYDVWGREITGIPEQACVAVVQLAERATQLDRLLADPPSPFPTANADGVIADTTSGEIHSESKTVGPIQSTKTYAHSGLRARSIHTSTFVGSISAQEFPEIQQTVYPILNSARIARGRIIRN